LAQLARAFNNIHVHEVELTLVTMLVAQLARAFNNIHVHEVELTLVTMLVHFLHLLIIVTSYLSLVSSLHGCSLTPVCVIVCFHHLLVLLRMPHVDGG